MEDSNNPRPMGAEGKHHHSNNNNLPESPRLPMEFLSRSWSLSALHLSKALSHSLPSLLPKTIAPCATPPILEEEDNTCVSISDEPEDHKKLTCGKSFSFACSATSQHVLERIMSQSEVSPMTSGRPSCSEPPTGLGGQIFSGSSVATEMSDSSISDSISPSLESDKLLSSGSTLLPALPPIRVGPRSGAATPIGSAGSGSVGSKTVGRWLKERREKKKEEARVYNAQLHAAVAVAAVAAAVAAAVSATAAAPSKAGGKEGQTNTAMATAATLVAARCVEAAEAMGAEREHLTSVISSAVNVQTHGDIMTLTAAAATALRGAATLKARTMKEMCSIAAVLPVERGSGFGRGTKGESDRSLSGSSSGEASLQGDNFLGLCNEELLARGSELLKRTRKGDLHWKLVAVYINRAGQVILKMKSRHVAGTITKKKKKVLIDVCRDMPEWPERRCIDIEGEKRRYFGLRTASGRVIEFECKNQQEYDVWTRGVSKLLSMIHGKEKAGPRIRNDVSWI